jgi:hypothetical protein
MIRLGRPRLGNLEQRTGVQRRRRRRVRGMVAPRVPLLLLAVIVGLAGCSSGSGQSPNQSASDVLSQPPGSQPPPAVTDDDTGMSAKVDAFLPDSYKVARCTDQHLLQGGLNVWQCEVSNTPWGPDRTTWNIAVTDDGQVVNASVQLP